MPISCECPMGKIKTLALNRALWGLALVEFNSFIHSFKVLALALIQLTSFKCLFDAAFPYSTSEKVMDKLKDGSLEFGGLAPLEEPFPGQKTSIAVA